MYRAIAWLGEELADQEGRTRAPRAIKDLVEERLFARRRDLFNDLDLVFFDTSALYFHGEGGETLGRRGKSKDHRPELKQVVIGVVIDRHGRPLCSETWPGNATDVQALLPVIDRLRARFCIGWICVVPDRGMISARTLAELEARGIEHIPAPASATMRRPQGAAAEATGPPATKPRKRRLTPRTRSATPTAKKRIHQSDQ